MWLVHWKCNWMFIQSPFHLFWMGLTFPNLFYGIWDTDTSDLIGTLCVCRSSRSPRSSSSWPPSRCTSSVQAATAPTQWACTAGGSAASTSSCCCCWSPWSWTWRSLCGSSRSWTSQWWVGRHSTQNSKKKMKRLGPEWCIIVGQLVDKNNTTVR